MVWPRQLYSNTPTQRSGPNSLIKPLWQLLASILGKTFDIRTKAVEEEEEYYCLPVLSPTASMPIPSICLSCLSQGNAFVRISATISVVGI